jgi:hypothetical protein
MFTFLDVFRFRSIVSEKLTAHPREMPLDPANVELGGQSSGCEGNSRPAQIDVELEGGSEFPTIET